jgi:hypothetical protein
MDYSNPNKIPEKTSEKKVDTKKPVQKVLPNDVPLAETKKPVDAKPKIGQQTVPSPTAAPSNWYGEGIKIGQQTVPSPTAVPKEVPVDENAPYDPVAKEIRDFQNGVYETPGVVPDRPMNFSDINFAQKLMGFSDASKDKIWDSEKERQGIKIPFKDQVANIPVEALVAKPATKTPAKAVETKPEVVVPPPAVGVEPQPEPVVAEAKVEPPKEDFWAMVGNIAAQTGMGIAEVLQAGIAGRTAAMQGRALDFEKETTQGKRLAREQQNALLQAEKQEKEDARKFQADQGQLDRDAKWNELIQSGVDVKEARKEMQAFDAQQNALTRANAKELAYIQGAGRVQAAEKAPNWRMQ